MCAHAEVLCTDITCSFSISRFLKGYEATGLVPELRKTQSLYNNSDEIKPTWRTL